MKSDYEMIKKFRNTVKEKLIEGFGGCCGICGYDKCNKALTFHHLDPRKKDFSISSSIKSWKRIVEEVKKCVMLCHNCHTEYHAGETNIPDDIIRFDESKIEKKDKSPLMDECPVCGKLKKIRNKTCSQECFKKTTYRVDWDSINIIELVDVEKRTFTSISKDLGVTINAVRKRYKKIKNLIDSGIAQSG